MAFVFKYFGMFDPKNNHKFKGSFNPLLDEKVQFLDENGNTTTDAKQKKLLTAFEKEIDKELLLKAYRIMCLSRSQDDWQNKMQRLGKVLSFLTSTGQEACEVAYGLCIEQGKDWFSSAYRNNAAWLATGVPMHNIMLYWAGNEIGSKMPENVNTTPINIPIATQYSHATGLAFAEKYFGRDGVVFTTTGDGGSSEGEFYEAMNFAKLHEVPAIFCVENNQFAISTPRVKATKALNFAVKAIAVGMRSIKVDGNDFLACYAVCKEAANAARAGEGPSMIEFETYRLGPHSSSDDPSIYRDPQDYEAALKRDPLIRMRKYLIAKGYWSEAEQKALDKEQKDYVKKEFKLLEKTNVVALKDVFQYNYEKMPLHLEEQYEEARTFFPDADK